MRTVLRSRRICLAQLLGLHVAGASENYGTEPEHLNNVIGARLHITALRAASGPGIEFLEYLAPRDGRPYPADTRANDLWQWQTRLVVSNVQALFERLRAVHAMLVSPGPVSLPRAELGIEQGLVVRDPDGHAIQLVELSAPAAGR